MMRDILFESLDFTELVCRTPLCAGQRGDYIKCQNDMICLVAQIEISSEGKKNQYTTVLISE